MNVPEDILFEIMKNFECIEDLASFCLTSKRCYSVFIDRKSSILKHYLNYFEINYKDPTNFIYLANDVVDYSDYFNEIDFKVNYSSIFKLYMKYYYIKTIMYSYTDKNNHKITSFPIYPNMTLFSGFNNKLTSFCSQPKMIEFYGQYNQLTSFSIQPKMTIFYGGDNQLTSFPVQPKMTKFWGNNNQLTSFEVQPEMTHFNGYNNKIESFSSQPKIKILYK